MNKNTFSIPVNLAFILVAYYAVNGNVICGNIMKFLAIITVIGALFIGILLKNPGKPQPFSEFVSHFTDIVIIGMLALYGWVWCTLAFSIGWVLCFVLFAARRKQSTNTRSQQ